MIPASLAPPTQLTQVVFLSGLLMHCIRSHKAPGGCNVCIGDSAARSSLGGPGRGRVVLPPGREGRGERGEVQAGETKGLFSPLCLREMKRFERLTCDLITHGLTGRIGDFSALLPDLSQGPESDGKEAIMSLFVSRPIHFSCCRPFSFCLCIRRMSFPQRVLEPPRRRDIDANFYARVHCLFL